MTTVDRVTPPAAPASPRIGQATAIEQSRAVAEVQAAIVVAQQCPRNVQTALAEMRISCGQKALADRAFFKFPRAGGSVSGASIHLARDLARTWGNIQYGIAELARDDATGVSEMVAYAWDVQTNTRVSNTFIVPHKRDKKGGAETLTELRDIYENNANNGARRVRECIFGVLPPWFVEEAKARCLATLQDGGGKTLAQRTADAIAAFATLGIVVDQLEQKVGRETAKWTDMDVAQLGITFRSLERGEVSKEDEFPSERVTVAEVTARAEPAAAKSRTRKAAPPPDEAEPAASTLSEPDDEDWPPVPKPGDGAP